MADVLKLLSQRTRQIPEHQGENRQRQRPIIRPKIEKKRHTRIKDR
jgi:hypothetical protein